MINVNQIDLTNKQQKSIAFVLLVLFLFVLYYILPPIILVGWMLLVTIAIYGTIAFLAYNYEILWSLAKRASWNMTKKIISSDKFWYLWQYHVWTLQQLQLMSDDIDVITSLKKETEGKLTNLIKENEKLVLKVEKLENEPDVAKKKISEGTIRTTKSQIGLNQEEIDEMVPRLEVIKKQETSMIELYDFWTSDAEIMKQKIESKESKWKFNFAVDKATKRAGKWLQGDEKQLKIFNESLRQVEDDMNIFAAGIDNFQRKALPKILQMGAQQDVDADEGQRVIEAYKQKRLQLSEGDAKTT